MEDVVGAALIVAELTHEFIERRDDRRVGGECYYQNRFTPSLEYLPGRMVAAGKQTAKSPTVRTSITAAWHPAEKLIVR